MLVVVCYDDGDGARLRRLDRLGDEGALAALHQRHRPFNIVGIEEGAAAAGGVAGDQGDARVSVVLEGGKRNCEFTETIYCKNNSAKNNNSSSGGSSSSYNTSNNNIINKNNSNSSISNGNGNKCSIDCGLGYDILPEKEQ